MSTSESRSRLPRFARRQIRPDCGRRNLGRVKAAAIENVVTDVVVTSIPPFAFESAGV